MARKVWLSDKFRDMASNEKHFRDHGETVWTNDAGKFHRIGKPAQEFENGDKVHYVNGLRHNETGPAIDLADGRKFFYLEGREVTEKQHAARTKARNAKLGV